MEEIKKILLSKKYLIIGFIVIILVISFMVLYFNTKKMNVKTVVEYEEKNVVEEEKVEEILKDCLVKVEVKGQVVRPGLYEVDCSSRVEDVINKAHGLTKYADISVTNLGKKVFDEMVIIIYSKEEVKNFITVKKEESERNVKCESSLIHNDSCVCNENIDNNDITSNKNIDTVKIDDNKDSDKKVSLNSATKEELMTISGIGESKALDIISYREKNNGFKNIDELKNISGIGEKLFEKVKNFIKL